MGARSSLSCVVCMWMANVRVCVIVMFADGVVVVVGLDWNVGTRERRVVFSG